MSKTLIEAVVENCLPEGEQPWPVSAEGESCLIRLHPGVSDEEVGSVMLTACVYNRTEVTASPSETLGNLVSSEGIVLPGGLRFSEGGAVKVVPGCCCGLEGWREWLGVPHGNGSVWGGHDPDVRVEYVGDKVRVWQEAEKGVAEYVELDKEALAALLKQVENDLGGFLARLGQWVRYIAPGLERAVVDHFAENMNIRAGRT